MKRTFLVTVLATLVSCRGAFADQGEPGIHDLRLIPFPKEVRRCPGEFRLDRPLVLELQKKAPSIISELISEELQRAGQKPPTVRRVAQRGAGLCLFVGNPKRPPRFLEGSKGAEEYALEMTTDVVLVGSSTSSGLLHGTQTLLQLIRANRRGDAIPCLQIHDWPSIRWRAFQDDITRGPSSTPGQLQLQVALGAYFKLNVFTYYMQHQFAFQKHPKVGPPDGSLTAGELRNLVEYAKPRGVEILGNQQSFAHMQHLLAHKEYAHLREDARTLSPAHEGTYRLLDDLYSEVLPVLPFEFFNVCCDETGDLGSGPSKELAKEIGVGGVYLRHILRVHDLVHRKYRKRMMMWGDIILNHPERIEQLPRDVVLLTWGYDRKASFEDQIIPFAKSGYEFFVCPGVKCWGEVLPNFETAVINIQNFVRDGAKHGALGVLNTSWDDDGENLNAPSWHGFAWGAECSWNASETDIDAFNRRVGAVLFGEKGDHFGQAIELLSTRQAKGYNGFTNRRFWSEEPTSIRVVTVDAAVQEQKRWLESVRLAMGHLEKCREEAVVNAGLLDAVLFGARRFELSGERKADRLRAAELYGKAVRSPASEAEPLVREAGALIEKTRDVYATLKEDWRKLWLSENRPYALDRCLAKYDRAIERHDALMEKLREARKAAKDGKTLPTPAEVGLRLVEMGGERVLQPRRFDEPLKPRAAWSVAGATHRLGLVVEAGSFDRQDLPLELKVKLSADLARGPVRAFRSAQSRDPLEIPAQLDPQPEPEICLLTVVLPGVLPAGSETAIRVYLGLANPPSPLSSAVSTRDGPDGAKWIQNDRVRLLLHPEGSHVYRWEVRALEDLDLTQEGQSGWAGFSDLGSARRSTRGSLRCTARGPALVRYLCTEEGGLTKTISVYAGTSWMDVTLSHPVSYYWDFDDPRHFASDAEMPGQCLFSNGTPEAVRKVADGADSQVGARGVHWAAKRRPDGLTMALLSPDAPADFRVGPGDNWGGVGIESSPAICHFVTYGGVLEGGPAKMLDRLGKTLGSANRPAVRVYSIEAR